MKKMKAFSSILLALCVIVGMVAFAGCNNAGGNSETKESITFLNSKGEIQSSLEEAAKAYEQKTGTKVEIIACPAGGSPFEKISSMYNAGTPPTLAMLDTVDVITLANEKALDLSGEKWVADAGELITKVDGKVYSFPMCVEGKGLIFNKTVIEDALGAKFDSSTINSYDKLKDLFEKLQAKGVTPIAISKEDWSLGAHFLQLFYELQAEDMTGVDAFLAKLKNGEVKVAQDEKFKQLMDTFDLLREYNYYKNDPLSADYDVDPSLITEGEVAFWFNGTWAWPNMSEFDDGKNEYGFIPVVAGNDTSFFGNNKLSGSASKQVMIDKVKATEGQQQAAKDFLNWLVYDEEGQKQLVENMNIVPAFSNITLDPIDPLGKALKVYMEKGFMVSSIVPADHWNKLGASMQQYLAGKTTRDGLAEQIEAYWKAQNK